MMAQANDRSSTMKRWILNTIGVTIVCASGLATWATIHFGSIGTGIAYGRGERVIVTPTTGTITKSMLVSKSAVEFVIRNISGEPVNLIGARTTCSCVLGSELPVSIAPNGTFVFKATINRNGGEESKIDEQVEIYTDIESQPVLLLRIVEGLLNEVSSLRREGRSGLKEVL